jgi:hypothetical protein
MLLLLVTLSKSYSFSKLLSLSRVSIPRDSFLLLDSTCLAFLTFFRSLVLELEVLSTAVLLFLSFLAKPLSSVQAVDTYPIRLQLKQRPLQRNRLYLELLSRRGFLDLPVYSTPSIASVTREGERRLKCFASV